MHPGHRAGRRHVLGRDGLQLGLQSVPELRPRPSGMLSSFWGHPSHRRHHVHPLLFPAFRPLQRSHPAVTTPHYPDTIAQSSQLQDTQGAVSPTQLQFPTVWSDDTPDISEYTVNFCLCGLTWTQGVQPASRAKLEATGLILKQVHLFTLPFILKTNCVFKMLHRKLKPETSWSVEKTWCFHWKKNPCIFVFILFLQPPPSGNISFCLLGLCSLSQTRLAIAYCKVLTLEVKWNNATWGWTMMY